MKTMEQKLGVTGTILSPLCALVGYLTDHTKELQALSYVASIIIAAFVIPWWAMKWWREMRGIFNDDQD